jgi:hypothetical protein
MSESFILARCATPFGRLGHGGLGLIQTHRGVAPALSEIFSS